MFINDIDAYRCLAICIIIPRQSDKGESGSESLAGSRAVVARYWGELATSYLRLLLSRCDAALKKSCLGCIEASWMIVVQRGPYLLSAR